MTKIGKENSIQKKERKNFEGYSLSDSNCWDVSQSQNGKYIA